MFVLWTPPVRVELYDRYLGIALARPTVAPVPFDAGFVAPLTVATVPQPCGHAVGMRGGDERKGRRGGGQGVERCHGPGRPIRWVKNEKRVLYDVLYDDKTHCMHYTIVLLII